MREGYHDMLDVCTASVNCDIRRAFNPALSSCPTPTCNNTSTTMASHSYIMANCMSDCSSSACVDAFHILQAHHDLCEHDDLVETIEDDYHDIADVCLAYVCNSATASFDANECLEHDDDNALEPTAPSGGSPSGSGSNNNDDGTVTVLAVTLTLVAVFIVVGVLLVVNRRRAKQRAMLTKHDFENPNFKSGAVYGEAESCGAESSV